jgi:sugar phosphate isomerase/epimerase
MNLGGHDIGVCDWSLKPTNTAELVDMLKQLQLTHVQLSLMTLLNQSPEDRATSLKRLEDADITIVSGMLGFADENYSSIASIRKTGGFVSPQLWPARRDRALAIADLAHEIGIQIITAHAGFIPPSGDPAYPQVVENLAGLANEYDKREIDLDLETGQEHAGELLQFLNDLNCPNVGVNFDPANMILYGAGDPCEAVAKLGRHVRHVHIKDANPSTQPGIEWGQEVPWGQGKVDVHKFLRTLRDIGYAGPLVIEREAGPNRVADVAKAIDTLKAHLGE